MLNVHILTIDHKSHRYETVGDWTWKKDGSLLIEVSDMGNWRYEFLVGFHEFAEAMICKFQGVRESDVNDFDIQFEKDRAKGKHGPEEECGDHPKAPYRMAHFWATTVERILAAVLMVNWEKYDKAVMSL